MAAKRTTDSLQDTFTVMHNLSEASSGRTVGELQMKINWVTRGQLQRVLNNLEAIGFVYHEVVKHGRTGKKMYKLTETAAIHCASIARSYTERN